MRQIKIAPPIMNPNAFELFGAPCVGASRVYFKNKWREFVPSGWFIPEVAGSRQQSKSQSTVAAKERGRAQSETFKRIYGTNNDEVCDTDNGPCACGAWH